MKKIMKRQKKLKNYNILKTKEKDEKSYKELKKEYNFLKQKNRLNIVNEDFIVYLFLNAMDFDDMKFAQELNNYHKMEEFSSKDSKIALGRFYNILNSHKMALKYLWPLYYKGYKLHVSDLHKLYNSLFEMAKFKEAEDLLRYAVKEYPEVDIWEYEILKYQIYTNHIYPQNSADIVNNLNYLAKRATKQTHFIYMAFNFYFAGYYQQSFNMFDKYFANVTLENSKKVKKVLFNAQNTLDSMNDIIDLLSEMDIVSFPIAGSLLGLVRDGKLFDHDKDADIGLFVEEYDEIYKIVSMICKSSRFAASGMVKRPKENALWNVAIYDNKKGASVDLFFFHKKENHFEYGIHTKNGTIKWLFKPFKLIKTTLAGREYYVPEDYEDWLTQMYGQWNETVVVWESLLNCPNLSKDSQIGVIFYAMNKLIGAIESKSLKKFDNNYNTVKQRWHFQFSKEADENLVKIRKELSLLEDGKNND